MRHKFYYFNSLIVILNSLGVQDNSLSPSRPGFDSRLGKKKISFFGEFETLGALDEKPEEVQESLRTGGVDIQQGES